MEKLPDTLWEYLWQFRGHLEYIVGGIIFSAILGGLAWWFGKELPWKFHLSVLVVVALIAGFLTWREERQARNTALREIDELKVLNEPKLSVETLQLSWGENRSSPKDTYLLVFATIINGGADTSIFNYEFTLIEPSGREITPGMYMLENFTLWKPDGSPFRTYSHGDALYEKTVAPLKRGGVVSGVLLFNFENSKSNDILKPGSRYRLTFQDYRRKKYTLEHDVTNTTNAPFQYFPGAGGVKP